MEPEPVNEDPVATESEAYTERDVSADKQKSYSRETKLAALQFYHECQNKYKTAKKFGIKPSTLRGVVNKSCTWRYIHMGYYNSKVSGRLALGRYKPVGCNI